LSSLCAHLQRPTLLGYTSFLSGLPSEYVGLNISLCDASLMSTALGTDVSLMIFLQTIRDEKHPRLTCAIFTSTQKRIGSGEFPHHAGHRQTNVTEKIVCMIRRMFRLGGSLGGLLLWRPSGYKCKKCTFSVTQVRQ
jgi:hypothetical protein